MRKLVIVSIIFLFLVSCATPQGTRTYTQKQGLMLQDRTEMRVNKKYHTQKRYNPKKARRKARKKF
jgi:uncharacterized protein YcfL